MPHGIEEFGNSLAAFVSGRQTPWHRLGTVTRECLTAQQAMDTAYLSGWNVRKESLVVPIITETGVTSLSVPDRYATVRTHPITRKPEVLGVVGSRYLPVQNEACAQLLDLLIDSSGAHFETAGSLNGGRRIFVTMKLPKTMRIAGVDDHDLYLVASTSHDGTSPLRVDATPVRVVCLNTLRASIRTSRSSYSFRHTSSARANIQQARDALGLAWEYFGGFQAEAERMLNEPLTEWQFEKIVERIWPAKKNLPPRARTNVAQRIATLNSLFQYAPTQANIRGSKWAAYQVITEYLDHFAPAREDKIRAGRVLISDQVNATKLKAFELLSA